MIQANELRIGAKALNDRVPVTVIACHEDYATVLTSQGNKITAHFDLMQPIPLTPEVLEKCGFEFKKNYNYKDGSKGDVFTNGRYLLTVFYTGEGYSISWWSANGTSLDGIGRQLLHLHDLQNLFFALTGEELAISPLK